MFNLEAPINQFGYGVVGYNIAHRLKSILKQNVNVFPIGPVQLNQEQQSIDFSFEEIYHKTLKIFHQDQFITQIGKALFGFPIFELNSFNKLETISLKNCDHVIVTSSWAREILNNNDIYSVSICNLGVDTNIFNHNPNKSNKHVFINIGKLEKRKGHDILPFAFADAFNLNPDYKLYMMIDNPFYPNLVEDYKRKIKNLLGNCVSFISYANTQSEVARIINMADYGVFPSRAEGWNLDLLECMACGLHTICTNYSAHTEYAGVDNSELISVESLESAEDGELLGGRNRWFYGQGEWAKINYDELVNSLRNVTKKKGTVNNNGIETAKNLSWDKTVNKLISIMR